MSESQSQRLCAHSRSAIAAETKHREKNMKQMFEEARRKIVIELVNRHAAKFTGWARVKKPFIAAKIPEVEVLALFGDPKHNQILQPYADTLETELNTYVRAKRLRDWQATVPEEDGRSILSTLQLGQMIQSIEARDENRPMKKLTHMAHKVASWAEAKDRILADLEKHKYITRKNGTIHITNRQASKLAELAKRDLS